MHTTSISSHNAWKISVSYSGTSILVRVHYISEWLPIMLAGTYLNPKLKTLCPWHNRSAILKL